MPILSVEFLKLSYSDGAPIPTNELLIPFVKESGKREGESCGLYREKFYGNVVESHGSICRLFKPHCSRDETSTQKERRFQDEGKTIIRNDHGVIEFRVYEFWDFYGGGAGSQ